MTRLPNGVPIFEASWVCNCGRIKTWIGAEAIIYSQTGKVVICEDCDTVWKLTPSGAQQLSE